MIKRIRLLLTDGSTTEYVPILNSIGTSRTYPNATHGLCYFHLVNQGWKKHGKPYMPHGIKSNVAQSNTISIIRYWLKSCFLSLENTFEYNYPKITKNNISTMTGF